MSLVKQLWLAISGLMILVFISSFTISSISAKSYYEEQLTTKNNDTAQSLAVIMTQMDKDPTGVELMVASQFDLGNYKKITLIDEKGATRLSMEADPNSLNVDYPEWFANLVSLKTSEGVGKVADGWKQYGTLYVESDDRFAYQALWKTSWQFFTWFLLVTFGLGFLGTWILRVLTRPLDDVVKQAESIELRRFITSDVPKTLEFRKVVNSMNSLTMRVKEMLDKESKRLEALRFKTQHDELTGLENRQYFMNQFDALLHREEQEGVHLLLMLRITELSKVNQQLGHLKTDNLLKDLSEFMKAAVYKYSSSYAEAYLARLNGSDFAVLFVSFSEAKEFVDSFQSQLELFGQKYAELDFFDLPAAAIQFEQIDSRGLVLQQIDGLLAESELRRGFEVIFRPLEDRNTLNQGPGSAQAWREMLQVVINDKAVNPQFYSVVDFDNHVLHKEAMMRIQVGEKIHPASFFLPWAKRLGLLPLLDLMLIRNVLDKLKQDLAAGIKIDSVAVNLSIESLENYECRGQLLQSLSQSKEVCQYLWLEMPEKSVQQQFNQFVDFAHKIKEFGCKVGIDRAGAAFTSLPSLQEVGLDYLKLDAALTQNLHKQDAQSSGYVRSVCGLGHSLGLKIIAEGVREEEVIKELKLLGFDGRTGPAIKI